MPKILCELHGRNLCKAGLKIRGRAVTIMKFRLLHGDCQGPGVSPRGNQVWAGLPVKSPSLVFSCPSLYAVGALTLSLYIQQSLQYGAVYFVSHRIGLESRCVTISKLLNLSELWFSQL